MKKIKKKEKANGRHARYYGMEGHGGPRKSKESKALPTRVQEAERVEK